MAVTRAYSLHLTQRHTLQVNCQGQQHSTLGRHGVSTIKHKSDKPLSLMKRYCCPALLCPALSCPAAHAIRWLKPDGEDLLHVRSDAVREPGQPIK